MKITLITLVLFGLFCVPLAAQTPDEPEKTGLQLGGYGEAVMSRHFYSDNINRYTHAANYKDAKGHGRFDLPHVVFMIGYDFGKGWRMNAEIEFEHGGTETAMELEAEEADQTKCNTTR